MLAMFLAISLTGATGRAMAADFDKAKAAYEAGDYATAAQEFRPLAEAGDAKSQFNLGVMYENGHGVAQDNAAAIKWYRRAAKAGHAEAQYNLGVMYDNGQGVPQNYAEAMSWYRRAAETGHAKAQNNLGFLYSNGKGVPQDYITAHMWANLAASNSNDLSTGLRAIIASEMSPAEIERAQARAAQCLASNYQDCGG
ncbi:MAG TPA: sel1 repeat family protein [Alphaproteobacteria bacterium]|nr:sel1 repeat family protein [Alphaproteobacteria bacterium]HCD78789.1 sel1 repeat family protein [Alphaproteobacteria bacterium]|tara:strand:- start:42 stop:632 length:591 start_codon:yes stop_codon:yes gene_type:complete